MHRYAISLFILAFSLVSVSALAQDAPKKSVAVTVYNSASSHGYYDDYYGGYYGGGYGYETAIVREVRSLELKEGENEVRFSDVPSAIDATTVNFKSLLDPEGTSVMEQNYEFDLVSADKVLQRYIEKDIAVFGKEGETLSGKLLSSDGYQLVLDTGEGETPLQIVTRGENVSRLGFSELPGGLITKPTLVWQVAAKKAGAHDVEVTYQTSGLSWNADYNLVLNDNDTAGDLSSWVTLTNYSGATFEDAQLKLVAGDVNQVGTYGHGGGGYGLGSTGFDGAYGGFEEKELFEYHLYTLGRDTTIKNNSTKQLELFKAAPDVPVKKIYRFQGHLGGVYDYGYAYTDQYYGTPNEKVDVLAEFQNKADAGLGIPMPAGRVRVYKRDTDGNAEFVGEDRIDHTPKDEMVRLKVGSAFDVVAEWKVADFKVDWDQTWMEETIEVTLRNHKKEAITVVVDEVLYRWTNWEITSKSQEYDKRDARNIRFDVAVDADGETKLTYTVRYTW